MLALCRMGVTNVTIPLAKYYNMKYSIYVRNEKEGPSCYYRIMQYLKNMDEDIQEKTEVHSIMSLPMFRANMRCRNGYGKKLLQMFFYLEMLLRTIRFVKEDLRRGVDVVVVSRETLPKYTPWYVKRLLEKLYKNVVLIWDFDDDIFTGGEISKQEARLLKRYSRHIVVTGDYLKQLLDKEEQKKVVILPTTDGGFQKENKKNLIEKRSSILDREIRLVWIGTSSSLKNLKAVMGELEEFAKYQKREKKRETILTVVCNQKLEENCKQLVVRNIPWTRQRAEKAVRTAHIGIMPLLENEYNLGKGGFKLIQYMAAGLPVAASAVGYNTQVIEEDYGRLIAPESKGWNAALTELISSKEKWKKYAKASHSAWQEKFSYQKNFSVWQQLLQGQFERKILYSIVIVNWNSGNQVKKCLDSMKNAVGKQYQIKKVVIVDNASSDHSADFDKSGYPFLVEVLRNTENMGFAYACNQGARICGIEIPHTRSAGNNKETKETVETIEKYAKITHQIENASKMKKNTETEDFGKSEYLLFLNPDTRLREDTFLQLSRYLLRKPSHIGITGIQLLDEQGHIAKSCSHFPNKMRRFCKAAGITKVFPSADVIMEGWDHKTSREVDQVMGAFFVISKELFEMFHGFDERFFVYYEEVDLSRRAKNAGYDSYFYADAKAFHKGGGTSEQVLDKRLFYILDSYLKYEKKHHGKKGLVLGSMLVGMEYFARLALLLAGGKKAEVKYLNRAYKELVLSRFR